MQKIKPRNAASAQTPDRGTSHGAAIRKQEQGSWRITVREKKPGSVKHLRALGCSCCG